MTNLPAKVVSTVLRINVVALSIGMVAFVTVAQLLAPHSSDVNVQSDIWVALLVFTLPGSALIAALTVPLMAAGWFGWAPWMILVLLGPTLSALLNVWLAFRISARTKSPGPLRTS